MTALFPTLATAGRAALAALAFFAAAALAAGPAQAYDDGCLTEDELIENLEDAGFEDVEVDDYLSGNRVDLLAIFDDYYYAIRVDLCTEVVLKLEPLSEA